MIQAVIISASPSSPSSGAHAMTETTNHELIVYCVWRCGGAERYIEMEDVFEDAFRVAPSRFGWRTRPLASDKAADQALRDVFRGRSIPKDLLLLSPNRYAVRLSAAGVAWVRERLEKFEGLSDAKAPAGHERASQRHLISLERSELVQAYADGASVEASRARLADLLRLTPDADARAWRERIDSYRADAEHAGRKLALAFLAQIEADHPDWFRATR